LSRPRGRELRIVLEDASLERAELGARLEPELAMEASLVSR
jgi:hypothetical protein